jgi:hypothetical protein
MANATGKAARKAMGTRVACKRAKSKSRRDKKFGSLPVSVIKGNTAEFIARNN